MCCLVATGRGPVGATIVGLGKCSRVDPKRPQGDFWGKPWGYYPTHYTMVGVGEGASEGAPPRRTSEVRVGTPKRIKRFLGEILDLLWGINPDLFD